MNQRDHEMEGLLIPLRAPSAIYLNEVTSHFPYSQPIVELGRPPAPTQGPLGQCSPFARPEFVSEPCPWVEPPLCSPPQMALR